MCDGKSNRRKILKFIIGGIGAATTSIIGVPAAMNIIAPGLQRRPVHKWRSLGEINSFPKGEIIGRKVDTRLDKEFLKVTLKKEVYVWRQSEKDFVVYSRSCTDLGCPVNYDKGSECFFCPCHGGIFSRDGETMAGPPRFPLYRYQTRIIDGHLEIDLTSVPVVA